MAFSFPQEQELRAEFINKTVQQITPKKYILKQALVVEGTDAWINYFWREDRNVLTAASGAVVQGIARLAEPTQLEPKWERVSTYLEKFAAQSTISWEDIRTSQFDVLTRVSIKIAEAVADKVDTAIWNTIVVDGNIQSFSLSPGPLGIAGDLNYCWDSYLGTTTSTTGSAAIIDDLFKAAEMMKDYNLPTDDLICFVSPKDKRSILNYLAKTGAQWQTVAQDVALNGEIGRLAGMKIVETRAVAASRALVVIPKRVGTWKENQALATTTKEDPYVSLTVRAVELGTCQLLEPKAAVLIRHTQK